MVCVTSDGVNSDSTISGGGFTQELESASSVLLKLAQMQRKRSPTSISQRHSPHSRLPGIKNLSVINVDEIGTDVNSLQTFQSGV